MLNLNKQGEPKTIILCLKINTLNILYDHLYAQCRNHHVPFGNHHVPFGMERETENIMAKL